MCNGVFFTPNGSARRYRIDMQWIVLNDELLICIEVNPRQGSLGELDCGCKTCISFVSMNHKTERIYKGSNPSDIGLSFIDFSAFEFYDPCLTDSDDETYTLDPVDFATPEHPTCVRPIAYICQSDAMVVKDVQCGEYYIVPELCLPTEPFRLPLIDVATPLGRCKYQLADGIITDQEEDHSRRWVDATVLMELHDAYVLALVDYNLNDFWSGYVVCSKNSGRYK